MSDASKQKFKYYKYDPSLAGDVVFIVIFSLVTIGHIGWMVKKKTWYFIPFVIGCLFEAVGYIARAIQATQDETEWKLLPYIIQALTILLAPALFAASIYMVLGRMVRMLDAAHLSIIRVNWLTKIFVTGDVLSFMAQGAGGGLLSAAKSQKDQENGNNIILGGLGIQVVVFGLFIVTTVIFHMRIAKNPTARSLSVTTPWRQEIWVLYLTSALIMIRSLFRMVEYALGWDSILLKSELYLFLLDGALMVLVTLVFLWYHPGRVLVGYKDKVIESDSSEDPEGRGETESQYQLAERSKQPAGEHHGVHGPHS